MVSRLLLVAPLMMTGACSPADQLFLTPLLDPGAPLALIGAATEPIASASEPAPRDAQAASPAPPLAASLAAYAQLEAGEPGAAGAAPVADATLIRVTSREADDGAAPLPAAPAERASAQPAADPPPASHRWRAAYPNVVTSCFPQALRRALDQIAGHFNREVLVTSGARQRGRRGSLHRSCKAADIRIAGVSPGAVAAYARKVPGVNGVGTYRWVSVTHVDVRSEEFTWRW